MNDPFDLRRFVDAQEPVFDRVRAELSRGEKTSHWMWFIFPQAAGLGTSAMSRRYAMASRQEAEAYLAHPVLGARLRECCRLVMAAEGRSAREIFGATDEMKLRACMTLFADAAPHEIFSAVLARHFA